MEELTRGEKINYIIAISTSFLTFLAFIGLAFTLIKFIETKFLGYKGAFLILLLILLGLFYIAQKSKRWVKNGDEQKIR